EEVRRRRRLGGELAAARIDADLSGYRRVARRPPIDEIVVLLEQPPAVADRDDRLALLAYAAEIADEIGERIERDLLAPPLDHLVGDAAIVGCAAVGAGHRRRTRIAVLVLQLLRVERLPIAFAPRPVARQDVLDGRRPPRR